MGILFLIVVWIVAIIALAGAATASRRSGHNNIRSDLNNIDESIW